jgi:hypothetical protein
LHRLRQALLICFADMIRTKPRQQNVACPQVWAGGILRVHEAESSNENEAAHIVLSHKHKYKPHKLNKDKDNAFHELAANFIHPLWGHLQDN